MKNAKVEITVTALVNGVEVPCELSADSKVIINGNLIIPTVGLTIEE